MTALLTTLFTIEALLGGLTVETGYLSQYHEQPSIDTRWYRQSVGQLPEVLPDNAVLMAVPFCDWIGREGLISIEGGAWEPLYAFDCPGSNQAYRWMLDNNIIGEIDYFSAERHGVVCHCAVDGRVIWLD